MLSPEEIIRIEFDQKDQPFSCFRASVATTFVL